MRLAATVVRRRVLSTSGTLRQYRSTPAMPAQMAPPITPTSIEMTSASGPGPPRRAAAKAAKHAPITSWPSWPMLTRPARPLTIVPSDTSRIGVATPMVRPIRPGLRTLPSSIAVYTAVQDPPVTATRIAASASAMEMQIT